MRVVRRGYLLECDQVAGGEENYVISLTNKEECSFVQFSTGLLSPRDVWFLIRELETKIVIA